VYVQTLYAFFAPPFSAVFVLGILFKRINAKGATVAVFTGFAFGILMKLYLHFWPDLLGPAVFHTVAPFSNQSILHWGFCVIVCAIVSLCTPPPLPEQVTDQLTLNWKKLNIFAELGNRWYQSVIFWWGLFAVGIIGLVIVFSGLFFKG
jgi:SSS family solute:Na+ symporter